MSEEDVFHLSLEEKRGWRREAQHVQRLCGQKEPHRAAGPRPEGNQRGLGTALHSENKGQSRGFTQDNDRVTFPVENHSDCRQVGRKVALTTVCHSVWR